MAAARGGTLAAAAAHTGSSAGGRGGNPGEAGRDAAAARGERGGDLAAVGPCAAAGGGDDHNLRWRRRGLRPGSGGIRSCRTVDSDSHRSSSSRILNSSTRRFSSDPSAPIPPCTV